MEETSPTRAGLSFRVWRDESSAHRVVGMLVRKTKMTQTRPKTSLCHGLGIGEGYRVVTWIRTAEAEDQYCRVRIATDVDRKY